MRFRGSELRVYVKFEPRDVWLGIFFGKRDAWRQRTFVCLVPMLPIVIERLWFPTLAEDIGDVTRSIDELVVKSKAINSIHYASCPGEDDDGYTTPGWYFWDEVQSHRHGPYPNRFNAAAAMQRYATEVLG